MLGITLYASYGGYSAGMQPMGMGWRFFSYHPLLMTSGFVGMMGSAAITKKRGGYTNTKVRVSHKATVPSTTSLSSYC
jgi:hypothetical protein